MTESRHISVHVERPFDDVYDFVSDPANLPRWASGLSGAIEPVEGEWISESPMGTVIVRFADDNPFGVVDHDVVLPGGETFHNPMRVLPDGDGAELVFTLRRADGLTDEEFDADAATVTGDLAAAKKLLEGDASGSE